MARVMLVALALAGAVAALRLAAAVVAVVVAAAVSTPLLIEGGGSACCDRQGGRGPAAPAPPPPHPVLALPCRHCPDPVGVMAGVGVAVGGMEASIRGLRVRTHHAATEGPTKRLIMMKATG